MISTERIVAALGALVLVLVCATPARADRIVTNDGQTFEGTIVSESTTEVTIEVAVGSLRAAQTFKKADLKSVTRSGGGTGASGGASSGAGPAPGGGAPEASSSEPEGRPTGPRSTVGAAAEKMLRALAARRFADAIAAFQACDAERCKKGGVPDLDAERRALAEAASRLKIDRALAPPAGSDLAQVAALAVYRYEHRCEACDGRGGKTCQACDGTGKASCTECHGQKVFPCTVCGGQLTTLCPTCGGGPECSKPCKDCGGLGYSVIPGHQNGIIVTPSRKVPCAPCNGVGAFNCRACGGKARVTCVACRASGKRSCPTCRGKGRTDAVCSLCNGGTGGAGGAGVDRCDACGGSGERPAKSAPAAPPPEGDPLFSRVRELEAAAVAARAAGNMSGPNPDELRYRRTALERLRAVHDAGLMDRAEYERRGAAIVEGKVSLFHNDRRSIAKGSSRATRAL